MIKVLAMLVLGVALAILALRLVFSLPTLDRRADSRALAIDGNTLLARQIAPAIAAHPGLTGNVPLHSGGEAFAARILLAHAAERSIDAQYYIWQNDITGIRLLDELRTAAMRGVRVRLLVDDNGTPNLDAELAALNGLPTAEVRIFNPFNLRSPRLLSYAFDFFRLNRRMHNKSFTVDGVSTIIGGRNVGDIYFSRSADAQYSDLDLLAVGKVVPDVEAEFDRYWNSASAYPHELLVDPPVEGIAVLERRMAETRDLPGNAEYAAAIARSPLVTDLGSGRFAFDWAETTLVADDPAKGLGDVPRKQLMAGQLAPILGEARTSIDLISAYFVPGDRGTKALVAAVARGVRVRTLTNALEATDVIPVHASYAKYRTRLIKGGVDVYELKANPGSEELADRLGLIGSSAASLHAKTFTIDGDRVFVGSFNFDPRSLYLNCEMGFLVRSPVLVAAMEERFQSDLGAASWRVTEDPDGGLVWTGVGANGQKVSVRKEPGATIMNRIALKIIGWLPVEWLM